MNHIIRTLIVYGSQTRNVAQSIAKLMKPHLVPFHICRFLDSINPSISPVSKKTPGASLL